MPELPVDSDATLEVAEARDAALAKLAKQAREPCPRCRGRMLTTGSEGDLACFSCGHQVYVWAPEVELPVRRRGASYGGNSLD